MKYWWLFIAIVLLLLTYYLLGPVLGLVPHYSCTFSGEEMASSCDWVRP